MKAMVAWERMVRGREGYPGRELAEKKVTRRQKKNKGWREQAREACLRIYDGPRKELREARGDPREVLTASGVEVFPYLVEEVQKKDGEERCREVAKQTMEERGEAECVLYTDGSVEDGCGEGGSACVRWWGMKKIELREAAGRWCNSFVTEARAMLMAVRWLRANRPASAVIFSDSQALLRWLAGGQEGSELAEELREELRELKRESGIGLVIQWVPGHVGLEGNEWADREANGARKGDQARIPVELACSKAAIEKVGKPKPKLKEREQWVYGNGVKREVCSRRESVLLAQLRVGHCPRTRYWRQRIGLEEKRACEDCGEEEGKDHWLTCERWARMRFELGMNVSVVNPSVLGDEGLTLRFLRRCYPAWCDGSG